MPTISAAEIFASFRSDGRNVALPGIATGLEPVVLLRKMAKHSALFVVEYDLLQLSLAMTLHDYTGWLAAGRLVFIPGQGEALVQSLCAFFSRHPGYELPAHLLTVPHLTAAEIAELQRSLEKAGQAVTKVQARSAELQARALSGRKVDALPEAPRAAVLSVDPNPVSLEHTQRIERALAKLGWPHDVCVPVTPGRCHLTARLETINRVHADLVLLVNCTAGPLRPLIPADLPVVSWYLPGAIVQPIDESNLRPRDLIFACSPEVREALVRSGAPAKSVKYCGAGADDILYHPVSLPGNEQPTNGSEVAILLDLPDDRAEACGIEQTSQVELWNRLREIVLRRADDYRHNDANGFLDDAQRQSGTTLQDPTVRARFVEMLRSRIAPAALARTAAGTLLKNGIRVAIWGHNWPRCGGRGESCSGRGDDASSELGPDARRGPVPSGDALNTVFNTATVVLIPGCSPAAVQTALDALAAGANVILRRPDEPFDRLYPDLASLVPLLSFYTTTSTLMDTLTMLSAPPGSADDPREAARSVVRREHTVSRRLSAIVETLRGCKGHR